jgi:hypothetical protein
MDSATPTRNGFDLYSTLCDRKQALDGLLALLDCAGDVQLDYLTAPQLSALLAPVAEVLDATIWSIERSRSQPAPSAREAAASGPSTTEGAP